MSGPRITLLATMLAVTLVAGELLRIRYFSRLGVPAQVTLTTFIYERALDLLVITALSLGAAHLIPLFGVLATVVLCLVLALCLVACLSPLQRAAIAVIDRSPAWSRRRFWLSRSRCAFLGACAARLRKLRGGRSHWQAHQQRSL